MTIDRARDVESLAAAWDAQLSRPNCSAEEREQFRAWIEDDPRNREAFDRLQAALRALRGSVEHPQLRALRETASLVLRRSARRRKWTRSAVIAGAAAALFIVSWLEIAGHGPRAARTASPSHWSTGPRERRTVALSDGSLLTLNASTQLQSEWLPHERRIRLLAGHALFRVAADKKRPFIVTAGGRTVTALGTVFDVNLGENTLSVTLVEGRVTVNGLGSAARHSEIELSPSQQLIAVGDGPEKIRSVDTAVETAWADGKVMFVDEPLLNAVTTMNQYSAQQIVADPQLAEYRINGMFRVGNQESFIDALTAYFPIEARDSGDGRIVLAPRGRKLPRD